MPWEPTPLVLNAGNLHEQVVEGVVPKGSRSSAENDTISEESVIYGNVGFVRELQVAWAAQHKVLRSEFQLLLSARGEHLPAGFQDPPTFSPSSVDACSDAALSAQWSNPASCYRVPETVM